MCLVAIFWLLVIRCHLSLAHLYPMWILVLIDKLPCIKCRYRPQHWIMIIFNFSRSGQNTSSESTPRHLALLNTSAGAHRRHHGAGARSSGGSGGQLARSQETFHQSPVHLAEPNRIETQIIVKNTNRREPIVKV